MPPVVQGPLAWHEVEAAGNDGCFGSEWLCAAAIRKDGRIYTGPRHNVIIRVMARDGHKRINTEGEMVFFTNRGQLLDRVSAGRLALVNGQVAQLNYSTKELYSEEVWGFNEHAHPDCASTVRCYQDNMISTPAATATDPRLVCLTGIDFAYADYHKQESRGRLSPEENCAARDAAVLAALRAFAQGREIPPGRAEKALLAIECGDAIWPRHTVTTTPDGLAPLNEVAVAALNDALTKFGKATHATPPSAREKALPNALDTGAGRSSPYHDSVQEARAKVIGQAIDEFVAEPDLLRTPLSPPATERAVSSGREIRHDY